MNELDVDNTDVVMQTHLTGDLCVWCRGERYSMCVFLPVFKVPLDRNATNFSGLL